MLLLFLPKEKPQHIVGVNRYIWSANLKCKQYERVYTFECNWQYILLYLSKIHSFNGSRQQRQGNSYTSCNRSSYKSKFYHSRIATPNFSKLLKSNCLQHHPPNWYLEEVPGGGFYVVYQYPAFPFLPNLFVQHRANFATSSPGEPTTGKRNTYVSCQPCAQWKFCYIIILC